MNGESVEIKIKESNNEIDYIKFYSEIYKVTVGNHLIETIYSECDNTFSKWIQEVHRIDGGDRKPLVAGVSVFRHIPNWYGRTKAGTRLPIAVISICIGGSHCVVSSIWDGAMRSLRSFLADRNVCFVGAGIKKVADELERDLGLYLSNPVELRPLVEKAFGEETVGLEEMAHVALEGMQISKKPSKFESNTLNSYDPTKEELMYCTRDSFLACRIAVSCLERINI